MSAPPPDMLPGKPEDYYTRIPRGMGGTDDRPWILARNILGALLFAGLAVYFNGAGNPTAALFCLTTAGALFLHSGRRRGKGGPMDPSTAGLPLICLAVLAFGGCECRLNPLGGCDHRGGVATEGAEGGRRVVAALGDAHSTGDADVHHLNPAMGGVGSSRQVMDPRPLALLPASHRSLNVDRLFESLHPRGVA